MSTPYEKAAEVFAQYAGMDTPQVPEDPASRLQVLYHRWVMDRVKHGLPYEVEGGLGVSEEYGELAEAVGKLNHAILNHHQHRRGMEDVHKFRAAVADALADIGLFSLLIAGTMRLDYFTLMEETGKKVFQRDWLKNPTNANVVAEHQGCADDCTRPTVCVGCFNVNPMPVGVAYCAECQKTLRSKP